MLQIRPVIEQAEGIAVSVARDLSGHQGLLNTARKTAEAAREAERVSRRLQGVLGLHRLPAAFLVVSLVALSLWTWHHFFRTSSIMVAVSETDAVELREDLVGKVQFTTTRTPGSRENLAFLQGGRADMAFVQGGVPIPADYPRIELPTSEVALLFLRQRITDLSQVHTVLTSTAGQGSHSLGQELVRGWGSGNAVRFVHDWRKLVSDPAYLIGNDIDAVFVVKDVLDEKVAAMPRRLREAGFSLAPVDFGATALRLPCLQPVQLTPGYLDRAAQLPARPLDTYLVRTYLVARPGLAPRQLAAARRLANPDATGFDDAGTLTTVGEASELLQGVDAFLAILGYIGLAFVALLGADVVVYRKRFHELNSLISLVSMHQSSKDVLGCDAATKAKHIAYLRYCSDLLGLLGAITGYYAQENSSLLYNKLLEIIPQRADALKINIQLKILHATVNLPEPSPTEPATALSA